MKLFPLDLFHKKHSRNQKKKSNEEIRECNGKYLIMYIIIYIYQMKYVFEI